MLVRMALVNNAPSTAAVLRSLLALSSLHRSGLHSQAAELKIDALKALSAASNREISAMETVQHVAAGMLLCSYEVCTFRFYPLVINLTYINAVVNPDLPSVMYLWSMAIVHYRCKKCHQSLISQPI
jgi:hypothetical protein